MSNIKLDYAGGQLLGDRSNQQDAYQFCCPSGSESLVCILADGMGGHVAGEVAANIAVDTFIGEAKEAVTPLANNFLSLLNEANLALREDAQKNQENMGMGCTLVAIEVIGRNYDWISIGDSPLYLVHEDEVERINANHSMAAQLDAAAQRGEITPEEAANSSSRNVLTSALTGDHIRRFDQNRESRVLAQNDWLILASDGIETLTTVDIRDIVRKTRTQGAKAVLTALLSAIQSVAYPGQDNVTICVITADGDFIKQDADQVPTRPIRLISIL